MYCVDINSDSSVFSVLNQLNNIKIANIYIKTNYDSHYQCEKTLKAYSMSYLTSYRKFAAKVKILMKIDVYTVNNSNEIIVMAQSQSCI